MSFYFAYGANMDQDLLHKRAKSGPPCGFTDLNLKKIGNAVLPNFKLGFTGYSKTWHGATATAIKSPGHFVKGVLYETTPIQEKSLDCFEDADKRTAEQDYKKIRVTVNCEGRCYEAYAYVSIDPKKSEVSKDYLVTLNKGYEQMKFENLVRSLVRLILRS